LRVYPDFSDQYSSSTLDIDAHLNHIKITCYSFIDISAGTLDIAVNCQ